MKKPLHLEVDFVYGDVVYLRCDNDGDAGIVTGWKICGDNPNFGILYAVAWGNRHETTHFAVELTSDKPIDGVPIESGTQPV